ncbi:MAG: DUF4388 domain-containing protein [Candidatus Sabulitectum sp.]|nr:DUF4388 domain-containing protein [Candidatus Sabulitectum sp.]
MAFNGNLNEFGVVALLQLPGTNHLSGRLIIKQDEGTAEFYYSKGRLVHAALGEVSGKEALVEVIDWVEGDFSFDSSSSIDEITIHQDIQNTLMWALKERDERQKLKDEEEQTARELAAEELAEELAAEELSAEELAASASSLPEPVVIPQSLMQNSTGILIAYLINPKGQIIAEAEAESDFIEKITPLLTAVRSFIRNYPDRVIGKTFIEDTEFTLALSGLNTKLTAVIFVSPKTRLGVLSIELGKFMRALLTSKLEVLNE